MASSDLEIVYVGDPMCSWCWGIAPALQQLREAWAEKAGFSLLLGGLRPHGTERLDAKMSSFLRHHWEKVAQVSGQPFKYDLLHQEDFVYDTEPACRAVRVVRELAPEAEFDFFKAVQHAFYAENKNPHEVETYLELCKDFDIDGTAFQHAFESKVYKDAVKGDFMLAARMGVRSFPTVLLKMKEELHVLAMGYASFADLDARLRSTVEFA
ncbi:MAG: DsbA family protein [Bacteroidota bacterium]